MASAADERCRTLPDRQRGVPAPSFIFLDRLRHEGDGLAISLRDIVEDDVVDRQAVGGGRSHHGGVAQRGDLRLRDQVREMALTGEHVDAVADPDAAEIHTRPSGASAPAAADQAAGPTGRRRATDAPPPAAVCRRPPAGEDWEVEAAVERSFHATRAAGFQGRPRDVDPDIATGHHAARRGQAVIVEEGDAAHRSRTAHEGEQPLCGMLSLLVLGMRFAGENHLRGTILVFQHARCALRVEGEQLDAFVSRAPAREPEGTRVPSTAVLGGPRVPRSPRPRRLPGPGRRCCRRCSSGPASCRRTRAARRRSKTFRRRRQ